MSNKPAHTTGMLVIISGPSGSGKGTVVRRLNADEKYALSVSVTTRRKREGEQEGVEYFFRTEDEFFAMRENGELLEHAQYVGRHYGTPRHYVEEQIARGKIVLLEIEVEGALQVKQKFPDAVLIFLIPPTLNELTRRLAFRNTEDAMEIEDRMRKALHEITFIGQYDYLVVNDQLETVAEELDMIVVVESLKPRRCAKRIEKFTHNQ